MITRPSFLSRVYREFTSVEFVIGVFLLFFNVLALLFYDVVDVSSVLMQSAIIVVIMLAMNALRARFPSNWTNGFHTFYVVPVALMVFKVVEKISYPIHGHDFDDILIQIDRSIFGTDPTVWLYHHLPPLPVFVEFLVICYFMYYWMPVIVAAELFQRRRRTGSERATRDLEELRFTIIYGLLVSYVCYLLLPGVGPRFTLHDFASIRTDLPGLFLTEPLRYLINLGENLTASMTNAEAMKVVTRDVFPSGHTEITLLTMLLAFRFRVRARWLILLLGSGLIFSTVYLRYHYVIDVICGALLAMVVLYSVPWAMRMLQPLTRQRRWPSHSDT